MKLPTLLRHSHCYSLALAALFTSHAISQTVPTTSSVANQSAPIPMDQLGAVAGKQYQGDGLSVSATPEGARLRCAFQRLEGQATRDGLWLSSTADNASGERFRVMAMEVGRADEFGLRRQSAAATPLWPGDWGMEAVAYSESGVALRFPPQSKTLQFHGTVSISEQRVQFMRPGLTEEYSVSVDGVRQDFIIAQRPAGNGELRVTLDVTGAKAEPLVNGARLVLDGSGRKLAYNRLRVTDAQGNELTARLEVTDTTRLAVVVEDANAIYPVRIDPTFSDADWISLNPSIPGASDKVYAAVTDASGNLYIGGEFTAVGDVLANRVAKWDGSHWSALGSGLNDRVVGVAVAGNEVYVVGLFTTAGGITANKIAKWNGSSWSALGTGVIGVSVNYVEAVAVVGNNVYVGGDFTTAGGISANRIARWNGSSWSALGSGITGDTFHGSPHVTTLTASGSDLYVGGNFAAAGGVTANNIAKWDGSNWSALGSGVNSIVWSLAASGNDLYAGGQFWMAGGNSAFHIAKWDGNAWSALGAGFHNTIDALTVAGTNLYTEGYLVTTNVILNQTSQIARWDGSNWTSIGSATQNNVGGVNALAAWSSNLYAGGTFMTTGGIPATRVAKWDGNSWSAMGSGINSSVEALAVAGNDLYIGGSFITAGSISANGIAKWNGSSWTGLGLEINTSISALSVSGNDVYAGGAFTVATNSGGPSIMANRVSKWNGSSWTPLALGFNGPINTLLLSDSNLYVGGSFSSITNSGGVTVAANCIAKWDGNNWSGLGVGMNNGVYALVMSGTDLYAGGFFAMVTNSGGMPTTVNYIAKWDGTNWSALGSGMNSYVYSLAAAGGNVYAGGGFTLATNSGGSTVTVNRIAKWNGSTWSALGSGVSGDYNDIWGLATSGNDVYVAGRFTTAGSVSASRIAKWNGSSWSALGSGMNEAVFALVVSGGTLYAGGAFTSAGGKLSAYVVKANISGLPFPGRFSNPLYSPTNGFSCMFVDASVGQPYRIQTLSSLAAGPWTDFTNFTYTAPITIIDASALSGTNKFFRAITP